MKSAERRFSVVSIFVMLTLCLLMGILINFVFYYISNCFDFKPIYTEYNGLCILVSEFLFIVLFILQEKNLFSKDNFSVDYRIILLLIPISILTIGVRIITSELLNIQLSIASAQVKGTSSIDIGTFDILCLIILSPILEELLFRGIILQIFLKQYNQLISVILSASFFALFHLDTYKLLTTFCFGIVLALIKIKTQSNLLCIFSHIINNATPIVLGIIISMKRFNNIALMFENSSFQPIWFDIIGIVFVFLGILSIYYIQKRLLIERRSYNVSKHYGT